MATAISGDVITTDYLLPYILCFITAAISFSFLLKRVLAPGGNRAQPPLPPTPPALPIIGHLHLIGPVISESFRELSLRYGPLIRLCIGASAFVVVSNASVAQDIFQTLDLSFSSRPEFGAAEYFIYRGSRFITAPYGDSWRFLKKLCMTRLLGTPQLKRSADVRAEEVRRLVKKIGELAKAGQAADLGRELMRCTNNIICSMAMSCRCCGSDNEADEIQELAKTCLILGGKLSVGDVLGPWLRKLDFSGNGKKLVSTLMKYDNLIEKIMEEHERNAAAGSGAEEWKKDLMDILLETHKDPSAEVRISRNDVKSFLLDLFLAGTDSTSTAMHWAMAELINDPGMLKKLRDQIVSTVGIDRLVKESDLPKLPYLQAVIKETLRLHTSAPLILRECREDCTVNGYLVKGGTRVLINAAAIMRDPGEWKDPEEFIPERFLEEGPETEVTPGHHKGFRGKDFKYVPFGSGRRGCVGETMAMLVMELVIGSLIQCFDWKVEGAVDLRQGPEFSAGMASPLVCYPVVLSTWESLVLVGEGGRIWQDGHLRA